MNALQDLFNPYQPSIAFAGVKGVSYEEVTPCSIIRPFIHCYWRLHTPTPLNENFIYRVVADGCIDILYRQDTPDELSITGFAKRFVTYSLGCSFDYVGIRFLPAGFPALFGISANQLVDRFLPLESVHSSLYEHLRECLPQSATLNEVKRSFDAFFTAQITSRLESITVDDRVLEAMESIMLSRGTLNLSTLQIPVSDRQLRRLFAFYFGASPKTFAQIVRFQNVLGAKPSKTSLRKSKTFFDEGYYDQAHFIKEFKAFYGVTPSKAFGR